MQAYIRTGGGFWDIGKLARPKADIVLAITAPAIPITTDGKTPDLTAFREGIVEAAGAALRAAHKPTPRGAVSVIDAAFQVMSEAYDKASAGGSLPCNLRQLYYAARPGILALTGRQTVNSKAFTQVIVPRYLAKNPETTADWDIVADARGLFREPHSGSTVPLGTIGVRTYAGRKALRHSRPLISAAGGLYRADGPGDRYGCVLLVEKAGFDELLAAAGIAERFDCATMTTKGMSTVAARALVEHLTERQIPVLVAHDLDVAGLSILGTLRTNNHRFKFDRPPDVRRLGLALEQAERMGLQSEPQALSGSLDDVQERLRSYGATVAEIEMFTVREQRIELNAMPADTFVRWLETELTAAGVRKVIPKQDILEAHAREILARRAVEDKVSELEKAARAHAATAALPNDLHRLIMDELARNQAMPWDSALELALRQSDHSAKARQVT